MQSEPALPKLLVYGQTDRGNQRPNNEDSLAWTHISVNADQNPETGVHLQIAQTKLQSHGCLFVVADGVGGNADGELASHTAVCDTLSSFYSLPLADHQQQLDAALQHATTSVHKLAQARACNAASTLVAALIWDAGNERKILFTNVGDSSGWIIRAAEKHTAYIQTVQHIENQALKQSIGDAHVEPHFSSVQTLHNHDWVVLCSDGLSDLVAIDEIAEILKQYSARRATEQLIALAKQRGGHDNITVLVIRNGTPAPPTRIWTALGILLLGCVLFGVSWNSLVPATRTIEVTSDSLAMLDWQAHQQQATSTLGIHNTPEAINRKLETQPINLVTAEPQSHVIQPIQQPNATATIINIPATTVIQPTHTKIQPSPSLVPITNNTPTATINLVTNTAVIAASTTATALPTAIQAPGPEIPIPTKQALPTATMIPAPTNSQPTATALPTNLPATQAPSPTSAPPTSIPTATSPPATLVPIPTQMTGPPIEIPPTQAAD